jgi:mannose-1-phosphate guanylyltransferase
VSLFTGIQVLDPTLLDRLPDGASDILDLYGPLVEEGEILEGVRVRGAWYDLGAPPLYLAAQLRLAARRKRGSFVDPLARVDEGARIQRSVVGARTRVGRGAVVERSVVWEDAVLEPGARVRGSIVTSGATVRAGEDAAGVMVFAPGALPPSAEKKEGSGTWVTMS